MPHEVLPISIKDQIEDEGAHQIEDTVVELLSIVAYNSCIKQYIIHVFLLVDLSPVGKTIRHKTYQIEDHFKRRSTVFTQFN